MVKTLGVSVYTPEQAVQVLFFLFYLYFFVLLFRVWPELINSPYQVLSDPSVGHIQIPHNLLDWRWRDPAVQKAFKDRPEVNVHARSMLLQGLLVNPAEKWPKGIDGVNASEIVAKLEALAEEFGFENKIQMCINYAMADRHHHIYLLVIIYSPFQC